MANATLSYARYFRQVFWPGHLAVYYPFPATFSAWSVAGAALLLAGISVAAFCLARRWPYVVVGWLWYLVTLLPVIGLIQLASYSHADRYTYVPLIGVFVSLVWGAGELSSRWGRPALACAAAAVGSGDRALPGAAPASRLGIGRRARPFSGMRSQSRRTIGSPTTTSAPPSTRKAESTRRSANTRKPSA